jgi:cytochrome c556
VLAADGELAKEPKFSRPAPNEKGTLSALLPPQFFVHQDALADSASALARAAQARDDERLAEAFGEVARTCIACHSTYLHEELGEFEHEEPE